MVVVGASVLEVGGSPRELLSVLLAGAVVCLAVVAGEEVRTDESEWGERAVVSLVAPTLVLAPSATVEVVATDVRTLVVDGGADGGSASGGADGAEAMVAAGELVAGALVVGALVAGAVVEGWPLVPGVPPSLGGVVVELLPEEEGRLVGALLELVCGTNEVPGN